MEFENHNLCIFVEKRFAHFLKNLAKQAAKMPVQHMIITPSVPKTESSTIIVNIFNIIFRKYDKKMGKIHLQFYILR